MQHFGGRGRADHHLSARIQAMTVEHATTQKLINSVPTISAASGLAEGTAQARATFENGMKSANKAAEAFSKANSDAVAFSRGSFEAMTQATQAYLAGVQNFSRLYLGAVQALTQHAVEGAKAFGGVKTVQDALAIQAKQSRSSLELAAAESAKLQEAALKVAKEVYAPLTQRATVALQQTKVSLAA
jgi:hypothetical protein